MNNPTDKERDLWVGVERHLLAPEDLQRRFGPLIDRGVETIEASLRARTAQRSVFALAGVKLWFSEGMQMLDASVGALADSLWPLPQPAPAWRGRGADSPGKPAVKTTGQTRGGDSAPSARAATQEGCDCRVRLDVEDDSSHPGRLRLRLALLTPTGERIRPIRVTVRDTTGRLLVSRQLSSGWSFAQSNVKPGCYAFHVEDETGLRWAECGMGADLTQHDCA